MPVKIMGLKITNLRLFSTPQQPLSVDVISESPIICDGGAVPPSVINLSLERTALEGLDELHFA